MYLTPSLFKCHHHFLGQFFVLTVQKIGYCSDCKFVCFHCIPVGKTNYFCCAALKHNRQFFKGGAAFPRADTPAGHADGVPLFQIPLLFVGKLLKCCRDRLCLYSVPEDFGVVPAIVARHILAGFLTVLIMLRAVEGNNAAVALGNGQQLIRRYAFVLVSCAPRGRC